MSKNKYNVFPKKLETIDYRILVLSLPENELEDLLTQFVTERGSISKSLYDDFLIGNCIGNLNQFMANVQNVAAQSGLDLIKLREEVTGLILKHNPLLAPDKIIINKNKVLKLKSKESKTEDDILLTENSYWNKSYYDEDGNYKSISDKSKNNMKEPSPIKNNEEKDINSLKYEGVQVWWERLNEYIGIKKFSTEDIDFILTQKYFHNSTSFNTYIVSNCVVNVEEIYERIDGMGVNVDPNVIIRELFELCKGANESISYTRAKELQPEDVEEDETDQKGSSKTQKAYSNNKLNSSKKKKKKLSFREVKKDELLKLADNMKLSLIGQNEAVDVLTEAIKRASVGLKDPLKPIGSFLFAGKTGHGKTMATKVLANELIKTKKNRIVIDCSEYSSDHEYAKLIGCFIPGTKVLMSDGSKKNIEEVEVNDEVISHKGKKRKVEFVHEYDQDGEMIELHMANTTVPVVTTKTHEVLAIKHANCDKGEKRSYRVCKPTCKQEYCVNPPYENYNLEWLPASELEVDDIVAYPRYKPTGEYPLFFDMADYVGNSVGYKYSDDFIWAQKHVKVPRYINVNEDLIRLAGYYVSEGGIGSSGKTLNFTFNSKEHDYIIEVVKLVRKVFGSDVRIRIEDRTERNAYRIWVSSKIVCNFMASLFGYNTYVKKTPSWFKDMPDNMVRGFLETAVFGDGCTVIPRRMDYSTVSSTLFNQMEILFRRLGYITYKLIEVKKNPKHKDRYRLFIGGNQIEKLNEDFNFGIDLSGMTSTKIQRKAWIDEDYVYFQLKGVSTINYTGKVYDLSVEEDVSYITEFIVHNSPHGYIGHDSGGVLTNAVMEDPFSVVVFDEIEKASTKVYDLLLQIFDEGRLTDGKGQAVSFKDTVVIMTSNIGVKEMDDVTKTIGFGDVATLTEDKKSKALDKAIKKKFKPELLNRIDTIIHFKDLNEEDYMRIIDIELYKLTENLKSNDTDYKDLTLNFDDKVRSYVYENGIDEKYGARPIKRTIEKSISNTIAGTLLEGEYSFNSIINTTMEDGEVKINIIDEEVKEANLFMHSAKG